MIDNLIQPLKKKYMSEFCDMTVVSWWQDIAKFLKITLFLSMTEFSNLSNEVQ